jgi:hypothetical protein
MTYLHVRRRTRTLAWLFLSSIAAGCASAEDDSAGANSQLGAEATPTEGSPNSPGQDAATAPRAIDLRLVFVHGVEGNEGGRRNAHNDLVDLEKAVVEAIQAKMPDYASRHPDRPIRVASTRVNLYTDEHDNLVSPGIDDVKDGTGVPSATAWRSQLAKKTKLAFGDGGNIVFIGHSTGARASAEVAAGVGDAKGPGSFDWGFNGKVAGVVTLHGMIDALNDDKYDFVGPISYVTGCRFAQGDGWCEYSGKISGVAALDWIARERHALSLVSWGSCSPSVWGGENDKSLPLRAQSSPLVPGMTMTPAPGDTYAPAHGLLYGHFCHSDVTGRSSPRHGDAVSAATNEIVRWLFDAAPRVVSSDNPDRAIAIPELDSNVASPAVGAAGPCPEGRADYGKPDVAGVCTHHGLFDHDHVFNASNRIDVTDGAACDGAVSFSHLHAGQRHGARLWMKLYSVPEGGGLLSTLEAPAESPSAPTAQLASDQHP